jgi:hypothetical protein
LTDLGKLLEAGVHRALKPLGYTKRRSTWWRDRETVIPVVNLQKSQWSDDWYLNLGVYHKALGPDITPNEHGCHIRTRAEAIAGRALPRDADALSDFVAAIAVPWLGSLATEADIATFLRSSRSNDCLVHVSLRARYADIIPRSV